MRAAAVCPEPCGGAGPALRLPHGTGISERDSAAGGRAAHPARAFVRAIGSKGDHDEHNLIDAATQVSNFLLINTGKGIKFTRYDHYIDELFRTRPLKYTVPLLWTYPSKQRTKRIQFKLPIII